MISEKQRFFLIEFLGKGQYKLKAADGFLYRQVEKSFLKLKTTQRKVQIKDIEKEIDF